MRNIVLFGILFGLPMIAADQKAYVSPVGGVFPQIADGGSWQTSITLVNMDQAAAAYTLSFHAPDGQAMKLDIAGIGRVSQISGSLAAKASRLIQTTGTSGSTQIGWAYLDTWNYIGGNAVFRQRVAGRPDFEAVVPIASEFDDQFVLPFDNQGATTAMAIVNPSTYSRTTVTVTFYDEAGSRFHLDQFTLDPGEHQAFSIADKWPQTWGRRGSIEFSGTGMSLSSMGLRFNASGAFTSIETMASFSRP